MMYKLFAECIGCIVNYLNKKLLTQINFLGMLYKLFVSDK